MARLNCPCGYVFHDVDQALWSSFASFLVTPAQLDQLLASHDSEDEPELRQVWACPRCRRLAIDDTTEPTTVTFYVPEPP